MIRRRNNTDERIVRVSALLVSATIAVLANAPGVWSTQPKVIRQMYAGRLVKADMVLRGLERSARWISLKPPVRQPSKVGRSSH